MQSVMNMTGSGICIDGGRGGGHGDVSKPFLNGNSKK